MYKKLILIFLCLSLILPILAACKPKTQSQIYYEYFDTESVVFSYTGGSEKSFLSNCDAVKSTLDKYHKLFDIYYEYSGINNLKTVNKSAGKSPVKIDRELMDFLLWCKQVYTLTDGKVNVAMGSVLKIWHDYRESKSGVPTKEELTAASAHCDINSLVLDEEACTAYISDPLMSLDVGATGKGYATEKAAEVLISRGVTSYVLNIGGNIRAIGTKRDGSDWKVGITHPNRSSDEQFIARVMISNTSLVTSGNYERYYTVDGIRYHHVIDPETLMPSAYFSSVSIFTENSALGDALSTALFCMSYEDGLRLVESIGGVEVIWVDNDYNVKSTQGVKWEY